MNQLTTLVLEMQGTTNKEKKDILFTDVYTCLQSTMEGIVNGYTYSLKGDAHAGYSIALEHLLKCVEVFNFEGYEFATFYKKTLRNKLVDLVRKTNADKVKHNTSYDVSLSMDAKDSDGYSFSVEDRFNDSALQVNDEYDTEDTTTLAWLLDQFHAVKPAEAEVLEILIQYSAEGYQKKDLTDALARHYGSEKYTGTIQKRVSRIRESFKKFAGEYGMDY